MLKELLTIYSAAQPLSIAFSVILAFLLLFLLCHFIIPRSPLEAKQEKQISVRILLRVESPAISPHIA